MNMREMKKTINSSFREKLANSLFLGGLTLLCGIIKVKLGMGEFYMPLKTWSEVVEDLPRMLVFSVGVSVIALIWQLFFHEEKELMICPKCEEPFYKNELPSLICPKCCVYVVSIKDYYKQTEQTQR
jgi:hypothetical protein